MRKIILAAPCALLIGCAVPASAAPPEPPKSITITLDNQGLALLVDVIQKSNAPHQEVVALSAEIERQIKAQTPSPAK